MIPHQRGMAIALLLWMVAAMALTVSAVVHFARGDTAMAQLRLQESKAYWLGQGAAQLAVRDRILAQSAPDPMADVDARREPDEAEDVGMDNNGRSNVIFRRAYTLDGVQVSVALYPAEGLISLNTASAEDLVQAFQALGGLDVNSAEEAAAAVIAYREQSSPVSFDMLDNPGFRYAEELLVMPGMTRTAYDRLRPWVHVHASGAVDGALAPPEVAAVFRPDPAAAPTSSPVATTPQLTFDSMYARAGASAGRGAAGGIVMAQLEFDFDGVDRYQQMIEINAAEQRFLRVGSVRRVPRGDP